MVHVVGLVAMALAGEHPASTRARCAARRVEAPAASAPRAGGARRTRRAGEARAAAGGGAEGTLAIIGGGWAGLGVATAAARSGTRLDVTLIDALPIFGEAGDGSRRTPTGKPFEAGHRGFWREYPNIYDLVENTLGVGTDAVFTDFTESAMYGPDSLEATAPVFGADSLASRLPSPLGQVAATRENFKRIPMSDLLSFAGLLAAMVDMRRSDETFEKYDRMTAHELFIKAGLSKRLVDDFLRPTLLVGLFKPPEELSAAVTMELLYYYALKVSAIRNLALMRSLTRSLARLVMRSLTTRSLARLLMRSLTRSLARSRTRSLALALKSVNSFDVRWMRSKSINEHMVVPLARRLMDNHGLTLLDACRVQRVSVRADTNAVDAISYVGRDGATAGSVDGVAACALAVGAKGLNAILRGSDELAKSAPELPLAASLGAIDVISVRIWLDTYVRTRTPANVLSRSEGLRGAGGTYFMLDQLQSDYERELWGGDEPRGSVLACDFYGTVRREGRAARAARTRGRTG